MSGEKQKLEYSEKITSEEVANQLINLAAGFRNRSVELELNGQSIALVPEEKIKMKIKASAKESKGELEIGISWKRIIVDEVMAGEEESQPETESSQTPEQSSDESNEKEPKPSSSKAAK